MKLILIFTFIFFLSESELIYAQQSSLSRGVNEISSFIASDYFKAIKEDVQHVALVDTLWLYSLTYNNGDITEALLTLAFACIPFKEVPIVTPLLGFRLYYPLPSAEDSVFTLKNENLPSKLFDDTPAGDYGDKDKLAHFFGSAFLRYAFFFFDLTPVIGYFVEAFEESFQVENRISERDMKANRYGSLFGKMLLENETVLPSAILNNSSVE